MELIGVIYIKVNMFKKLPFDGLHLIILIILTGLFTSSSGFSADIKLHSISEKIQDSGNKKPDEFKYTGIS